MKVVLEKSEAREIFHNALCNALGYMSGYGLEMDFEKRDYEQAKLKLKGACYEDVLLQILVDGNELSFIDNEADEDDDPYTIDLDIVYERMADVPNENIMNMINETDDAEDADIILQTVFLGEITFG